MTQQILVGDMTKIRCKGARSILIAATLLALTPAPMSAQQQPYNRSGLLTCVMSPTVGLIIGSRQTMTCEFKSDRGFIERYAGVISRIGLDLGITAGGQMGWAVLMSADMPARGGLAGTYVGGSGDISLGIGVGANALIGGSNKSVALQPLSVEGQIGINLALGIANLQLRPVL
jgi:hypothetical protein